ncbi:MAG: preprotein translocase subunit YajC, partial [Candidatus Omnitrophica bacterium]|nr:preprotein translocase subunit YajC [Candidatus Omnitrophota bacterium]
IIFYFFLIRPQKKRQQEHELLIAGLKKNDEVVTSGGIHGTIVGVKDTTFSLRIDENTKIDIDKLAVAQVKKARQ